MYFGAIEPGETGLWPYDDLVLRTSRCPWCGFAVALLVAVNMYPMAWCLTDDCPAVMFDPTKTAEQLIFEPLTFDDQDVTGEAEPPT